MSRLAVRFVLVLLALLATAAVPVRAAVPSPAAKFSNSAAADITTRSGGTAAASA